VIKRFAIQVIFLLAVSFFISACASQQTTAASGDSVPGEKVSDEGRLAPGTGTGPNASVKW